MLESTLPAAVQVPSGYSLHNAASYREQSPKSLQFQLYRGDLNVQLALGETQQIKKLDMLCNGAAFYALTELPSSMSNLEILNIYSKSEVYAIELLGNYFTICNCCTSEHNWIEHVYADGQCTSGAQQIL